MNKAWIPLAALPLLACFLQAASPVVSEIPLPEKIYPGLDSILRSAVQQSPRMVSRALDMEMADNDRITARSNLLPTLNAGYSYNGSRDTYDYIYAPTSNGNPNPNSSITTKTSIKTPYWVTLSQPLFYWGERRNNDKIGEIQQKIARGQYRQGYRLLAQELRGGYLRLIVQKLALKRARFYQQYVNNMLKLQEERLLKKVISEVDISVARLNAEQGQLGLERTELDYTNAKRSFARLAGLGTLEDEAIPDAVAETAYAAGPFDQLLAEFLAQKDPVSVEAFNLRQQIEIANLNYANAKTRLRPKVNAVLGLSQDDQTNLLGAGSRYGLASRYIGISVNWTLFDGLAAGAAARNALMRRRGMENDYHQLTEQLAQDAQTAVRQLNFSARSMAIQDRLLVNNSGYLRTMKDDFRRGVKSESDVDQIQLNVYDSEVNASNARMDYLLKIGDFLGALNEDPIVANLPFKS